MSKVEIRKPPKAKVLVVDDELIVAMDIKRTLEIAGYQITAIAVSAKDALLKTEIDKPDIILMDIILKGSIDGIEAAKTIIDSHDIPIIFITASSDPQTFERAKLIGHYGYLIKPLDQRDLFNSIEMALYKHEMEKKTRKSEEHFRLLYENAPVAFQSLDKNGVILNVNLAWEKMLGFSKREAIGTLFGDYITSDSNQKFPEAFEKFKSTGSVTAQEFDMVCKDGSIITISADGTISYNKFGEIDHTQCILYNITERIKIEDTLNQEAIRNRIFMQTALDGILIFNQQHQIIEVNQRFTEMSGYTKEEVLKMHSWDFDAFAKEEGIRKNFSNLKNIHTKFETMHRKKDGSLFNVEITVTGAMINNEAFSFTIVRDITERKDSERILRESEEKYKSLFENNLAGVYRTNLKGEILDCNKRFLDYCGYSSISEIGNSENLYFSKDSREEFLKKMFLHKSVENSECLLKRKDGSALWITESVLLLPDKTGELNLLQGTLIDITESKKATDLLKQSELMLRQTQKTARIGYYFFDIVNDTWTSSEMLDDIFGITPDYQKTFSSWFEIIYPNDRDIMNAYFSQLLKRRKKQFNKEYRIVSKNNGKVKWVHGLGALEYDDEGNPLKMTGAIQDITDRKIKEVQIIKQNEKLSALFDISKNVSSTLDVESILQSTADSICEMDAFDSSAIYLLEGDYIYLKTTTPPLPKKFPEILRKAELKNHPLIKNAMFESKTIIIADTLTADLTEEERAVCVERKLRSILYLPLHTSEGTLGCLIASSRQLYDITKDDVEICETIANLSALALEKARLYEFSQKNILDLEYQIGERVRIEGELKEQLEEINRFNLLMVGRENRMIELKKETNELLIKIGLQPKYRIDDN